MIPLLFYIQHHEQHIHQPESIADGTSGGKTDNARVSSGLKHSHLSTSGVEKKLSKESLIMSRCEMSVFCVLSAV